MYMYCVIWNSQMPVWQLLSHSDKITRAQFLHGFWHLEKYTLYNHCAVVSVAASKLSGSNNYFLLLFFVFSGTRPAAVPRQVRVVWGARDRDDSDAPRLRLTGTNIRLPPSLTTSRDFTPRRRELASSLFLRHPLDRVRAEVSNSNVNYSTRKQYMLKIAAERKFPLKQNSIFRLVVSYR